MDEYISRNELLKVIQSNVAEADNERCVQLLEAILNAPTADVVPKSECVEYEYKFCHIVGNAKVYTKTLEDYYKTKKSIEEGAKSKLEISQHLLKAAYKRVEELDKLCGELQRKYDMSERKFADEEVIKALEWCIQNSECEYCEYREKTDKNDICPIRTDALNLINKQKTELEQLKRNLEQCENGYSQELHLARCQLADAKSEVEKLQNELVIWKQNRFNLFQRLECYEMAKQKVASEIFAEIEKEIDTGLSVIEKILNTKSGRANGKTVLLSKYDVYREAKKHLAELKKEYTEGDQ